MWDLIVSVPDQCLSFYFQYDNNTFKASLQIDLSLKHSAWNIRLTLTNTVCTENPIDDVKSCTANNYSV